MTKETHHPPLMGLNHTAHYAKSPLLPSFWEEDCWLNRLGVRLSYAYPCRLEL